MHRVWFVIPNVEVWYKIIREANDAFGKNWRGQQRVKRKFEVQRWASPDKSLNIWFDVPDPKFAVWVAVKHSVTVMNGPNK